MIVMTDIELNKELYRKIYLVRMTEEKVRELYPTDVFKTPVHLSHGEESIVAGVCQALSPDDQVYGSCRGHALYLCKNGSLEAFFGELYGNKLGVAKGKAGSMHLSSPDTGFIASSAIVAGIIPVALGAAFAAKYKKEKRIVAVFFGDGATEEGVYWETLNFASLNKLPILFVCEDNGLAIHSHIAHRQSYVIPEAVKPFGIQMHFDDTTDPEIIYNAAKEAARKIKETGKPYFLHFKYHRYLEHVGINEDYQFGYRRKEDYTHWYSVDPIKIQRNKLLSIGVAEAEIQELEAAINKNIEESVKRAAAAEMPEASELFKDVYA